MMIKPIGLGIGKVDTKFVGGSNVNMKGFKEDKKYGGTGIGMGKGPGKSFKGKVSGNKVEAKEESSDSDSIIDENKINELLNGFDDL